jgi:anaerobic glycerol-3-phosphate dehydrogenase
MDCSTEERDVIKVWFDDSGVKNICSELAESMPKRVQEVILAKGGHIS